MDIEFFRTYCLSKKGVTEETPFGPDTLVFKVAGKLFALTDLNSFESVNLKCDPEQALELRERYSAVAPGFHMNKKHWNTVSFDIDMPDQEILSWLDHSYDLVFKGLTKKQRAEIEG